MSRASTPARKPTLRLRIDGDMATLRAAQRALSEFLARGGASERGIHHAELALDELVTNVIRHAYAGNPAQRPIDVTATIDAERIVLAVEDEGPEFNPGDATEPEIPTRMEDARPGGLGLRLLRLASATLAYDRRDGRNRVVVAIDR